MSIQKAHFCFFAFFARSFLTPECLLAYMIIVRQTERNDIYMQISTYPDFTSLLRRRPQARASLVGSKKYPCIRGEVRFYQASCGVLVAAEICGLPVSTDNCQRPIFGFHIHEHGRCTGNEDDPFADVGTHYDPEDCPHPYHAGDLPPLFGVNGYAFSVFLTNRFTIGEIIGKAVIIHASPDDFTSQPSGNSGEKAACGTIRI